VPRFFSPRDFFERIDGLARFPRVDGQGGEPGARQCSSARPPTAKQLDRPREPITTKAEILKESLARTLYDLVRTPQFVPFSILFASGQRLEIKTREHISLGPVSRADVEELKTLIVWDDAGRWRSLYLRAILKIERSHP
jgi:hypothetical protein